MIFAMQIGLITERRRDWELWRQDDAGNQYLVERYVTRELAQAMLATYESRNHKQVHWIKHAPRNS